MKTPHVCALAPVLLTLILCLCLQAAPARADKLDWTETVNGIKVKCNSYSYVEGTLFWKQFAVNYGIPKASRETVITCEKKYAWTVPDLYECKVTRYDPTICNLGTPVFEYHLEPGTNYAFVKIVPELIQKAKISYKSWVK